MKVLIGVFNQEKALVGAYSVITNLRMELFQALDASPAAAGDRRRGAVCLIITVHIGHTTLPAQHLAGDQTSNSEIFQGIFYFRSDQFGITRVL